jgi:penicillin G amidase
MRCLARPAVHAAGSIGPCRTALSSRAVTTIRKSRRFLGTAAAILGAALAAAAAVAWLTLRASLPTIDGYATLSGIAARVSIERDAMGVPTIKGGSRNDLARGLGYVHGQDRFFQMDLLRRAAAGELSALLGPALLPTDRQLRKHRFRAVARAILARLDPPGRALLDAYVAGVNAGLSSLRSRPFEYWVLNGNPQPWSAEDSILCVDAMFLQLGQSERGAGGPSSVGGPAAPFPVPRHADGSGGRRPGRHAAHSGTRLRGIRTLQRFSGTRG